MNPITCAACGKQAPPAESWPDGWMGVAADGTVVYPVGTGAFTAEGNVPASSAGNEAVCSDACLGEVRERRKKPTT